MALSDFQIFNDHAYNSFVTSFQQNAELFNSASNNAIQLRVNGFSGDYKSKSQFENLASLVGNRDAGATGPRAYCRKDKPYWSRAHCPRLPDAGTSNAPKQACWAGPGE